MKKQYIILLLAFTPFLVILSCQKEMSYSQFNTPSYSEKTFSFSNAGNVELKTPTGLKIKLPANAFVKENGQRASGDINLLVKEFLKPDAMILENKTTMSNGLPLQSGGEFYVRATSGNDILRLAPNTRFSMELPKSDYTRDNMSVFNGTTDPNTGDVNWQLNNTGSWVSNGDTLRTGRGAVLFSDNTEWINCDRFINEPLIRFTANAGNCPDIANTTVYVHLTGRNSVLKLPAGANVFESTTMIEASATIIGICLTSGNLSASFHKVNMKNGQSVTLDFIATTKQALKQRLAGLY